MSSGPVPVHVEHPINNSTRHSTQAEEERHTPPPTPVGAGGAYPVLLEKPKKANKSTVGTGKQQQSSEKSEKQSQQHSGQQPSSNWKPNKQELMRWFGYLTAALLGLSSIWLVPRTWSWMRGMGSRVIGLSESQKAPQQWHQEETYQPFEGRAPKAPMAQQWYPGTSSLSGAYESLDTLANMFWRQMPYGSSGSGGPSVTNAFPHLRDVGNYYHLSLAVPGFSEKDVNVKFSESGSRLRVNAYQKMEGGHGEIREIAVVTVPRDALVEKAGGDVRNGILMVNIPKRPGSSSEYNIPIQGASKPTMSQRAQDYMGGMFSQGGSQSGRQGESYSEQLSATFGRAVQDIYQSLPQSMRDQPNIMESIRSALRKSYESRSDTARQGMDMASEAAQGGWDRVREAGQLVPEAARQYGSAATDAARQYGSVATEAARQYGAAATDRAKDAGDYLNYMGSAATDGVKQAGAYMTDAGSAATERLKEAGEYVMEQLQHVGYAAGHMGQAATEGIKHAGSYATEGVKQAGAYVTDAGTSATARVKEGAENVVEGVKHMGERVGETVAGAKEAVRQFPSQVWGRACDAGDVARGYVCEHMPQHQPIKAKLTETVYVGRH
ncbi:hypothetical protein HDU97_010390 [Phlyctochytrium planicorne]|nr:hypothetical protein HDU97_010390 [Phlyctochytrium planicorne]